MRIWLGDRRGHLTDWLTQRWVQVTGRKVDLALQPWLDGPVGAPEGIGADFFDRLAAAHGQQLAIEQAMARAADGTVLPIKMGDLWPAAEGWVKMQQVIESGGKPINVHYVFNTVSDAVDDFKIIIRGRGN